MAKNSNCGHVPDLPSPVHRYHRQTLLPGIGEEGQGRIRAARVVLVGCGALGTVIADSLARAGIGRLTIVDRDIVEITNLQRQVLFDERDVERGTPKAIAAREKLARINSEVEVEAIVEDFNHTNAERIASLGCDLILDGLDNFQARYLLNDLSVSRGVPYVYGGAVGTTGMACVFIPGETPCLRCVFPEAPPPGTTPTCDTAGVLASAVAMVAHHQVTQAIKLITGNFDAVDRSLISIDVWQNEFRRLDVSSARGESGCVCCGERRFEFLHGEAGSSATSLCGRGAVQINPRIAAGASANLDRGADSGIDLALLASRLAEHGDFTANEHLLRGRFARESGESGEPVELTVFPDGRAIVGGTGRPEFARAIYDRYIGG